MEVLHGGHLASVKPQTQPHCAHSALPPDTGVQELGEWAIILKFALQEN